MDVMSQVEGEKVKDKKDGGEAIVTIKTKFKFSQSQIEEYHRAPNGKIAKKMRQLVFSVLRKAFDMCKKQGYGNNEGTVEEKRNIG